MRLVPGICYYGDVGQRGGTEQRESFLTLTSEGGGADTLSGDRPGRRGHRPRTVGGHVPFVT